MTSQPPKPKPVRTTRLLRSVVAIDILMIVLLVINLAWLLFDAAFEGSAAIRAGLSANFSGFYEFYRGVHENFALIDMGFVAVFIVELVVRWIVAARCRTYRRWYFYPLVHWYDVLGCVPTGSMRFLRFLRIFAIILRAHRMGVIDVRTWALYRVFQRYRRILVEEISDRVVVHVLTGIQAELSHDSKVIDRIWREAIAPHKDVLVHNLEAGAARLIKDTVKARQPAIDAYVERVLTEAMRRSHLVFDRLAAVPLVGKGVVGQIQTGVRTIVRHVIAQLHEDAMRLDVERLGAEVERSLTRAFADQDADLDGVIREVITTAVEVLKDQVKIQQWKLRDEAARDAPAVATT